MDNVVVVLGSWNGWTVVQTDGRVWLVNPITGHRMAAGAAALAKMQQQGGK